MELRLQFTPLNGAVKEGREIYHHGFGGDARILGMSDRIIVMRKTENRQDRV